MSRPAISVIMPTYRQAAFLPRAAGSLLAQTTRDWELVIVDDGSPDDTREAAGRLLHDPRVRYLRLARNRGLGAALNSGLALAAAPVIAYLPSDDLYDPGHLAALLGVLADPAVLMAVSGARGRRDGHHLQLVQVAHRAVPDRWTERAELESDDLDRLYWARLRARGGLRVTGRVTCTWTDHPGQRHKAIREAYDGGLNVFRSRYEVAAPLRFHSTDSGEVDEVALYDRFRRRSMPPAADGLTILLVGELAYNPERVLALAERGHRLYGLWTRDGLGCNTVGPCRSGTSPTCRGTTGGGRPAGSGRMWSTRCSTGGRCPSATRSCARCPGSRSCGTSRRRPSTASAAGSGRCSPSWPPGRPPSSTARRRSGSGSSRHSPAPSIPGARTSWTATCPRPTGSRACPPGRAATARCTRSCSAARSGSTPSPSPRSPGAGSTSICTAW
ncbi:glycosyltransferase [Microbispora sp. ZYX-F-249]|uniref:Glycosyltransferase n=1 Tax=Microbispora maris TaxID=3144104 RepID=A0ABV0AHA2_9ACTN